MSNLSSGGLSRVLTYLKTWITGLLNGKANSSHTHTKSQITDFPSLSTVATSGSYSDLSNKPAIPTNTNQLTNGAGYLSGTVGITNGGTGATTRLEAAKNLTNENVGTSTQYFFTLTENWGKVGYASVADAKSVLGVPSLDLRPQASADANTVSDGVAITHYGANGPSTSLGAQANDGALFQQCWSSDWKAQIAADYRNGNLFTRGKNSGTWQPWRAVAYHGDNVSKFTNDSGYITSSGSCNYANSAGYASSASGAGYLGDIGSTDRNGASGTGWYSVGFSYSYDEGHNELAINNYWGIRLNCRDSDHVTVNGSRINVENATYLNGYRIYVG